MANTIKIESEEELELIINSKSGLKIIVNSSVESNKTNNCQFVWDNGCFLSKDELED